MDIEKKVHIETSIDLNKLETFLYEIDKDFVPNLSKQVSIPDYAKKLINNANFFVATSGSEILGIIVFYSNDVHKKNAYISILGISWKMRGLGLGTKLIKLVLDLIRLKDFETLNLETRENSSAQKLYEKLGFKVISTLPERTKGVNRIQMRRWISNANPDLEPVKL